MRIVIETIAHDHQRYETVGDWWFHADGTLQVRVSEMCAPTFEVLVGLHEVIEAVLCKARGIDDETVTDFDMTFEATRAARAPDSADEPGDARGAPYRREHFFATTVERLLAAELKVDWQTYEDGVNALGR